MRRICTPRLREDMQERGGLETSEGYIRAARLGEVGESLQSGEYNCPDECPGLRKEPRTIGKFTLPMLFAEEKCGRLTFPQEQLPGLVEYETHIAEQ